MNWRLAAVLLVFAAFWAAIVVQGHYPKQIQTPTVSAVYQFSSPMANNTLIASDNFQRSGPGLGANWTQIFGATGQIVANQVEPVSLSTNAGQVWTATTWPNDQASEFTIGTLTAEVNTYANLAVRFSGGNSGYLALLTNNTLTINRYDAGVGAQLQSPLGVTVASGDVWTFQAAGSCLSVYQNNKRIVYVSDATYSSGSPGFVLYSSVNITHTQISAWRGYSYVQQDGIWQKQAVVLPALAGDLTFGVNNVTKILYEGGAQLLSGTVYKTWFSNNTNIYYAESLDGISWTRRVSPVISNFTFPTIIKSGSTYYLYCQPTAAQGTGNFALYTSTDGVAWTQQSANVFSLGIGGAWDSFEIWGFAPVYINGSGTWYALYTGSNSAPLLGKLGVATSPDGITWTRYAGNPVATDFWNSQAIVNVNGIWYMWGASNQAGQTNSGNTLLDPTDTIRMQSTDLITWTNKISSIHHAQLNEGINGNIGQSFANSIIDINGKAYLYYTTLPNDGVPAVRQIALAVGPSPIASIVTGKEDAASQVASDGFTSGVGSLSAKWTTPVGGTALQIIAGNLAEPTATGVDCQAIYTGALFSNDQYAEVTLTTLAASSFTSPLVRASTNALTWYEVGVGGPTGSAFASTGIYKRVGGVQTQIGPLVQITPQVGDVFRLSVVGSILSLYQNGYIILQVQDYNSSISTGRPGFKLNAATAVTNAQISLWAGGGPGGSSWIGRERKFVNKR